MNRSFHSPVLRGLRATAATCALSATSILAAEYTSDGDPDPRDEEVRWHLNRGRFDPARENQKRNTNHADVTVASGPLAPHGSLVLASRRHCEDMARTGIFQHATVPGSAYYDAVLQPTPWDRMAAEGYHWRTSAGENLCAGPSSGEGAYLAWWNSTGHRKNMFSPVHEEVGIGHASAYYGMGLAGRGIAFFTDTIFHDKDSDGSYDEGEGVAGIRVQLSTGGIRSAVHDVSGRAGAFAIPLEAHPPGTEVFLLNTTGTTLFIHIPRSYDRLEVVSIKPGEEVLAGTFPSERPRNVGFRNLDASGVLPPPVSIRLAGGLVEIRWPSERGVGYTLQTSTNLSTWFDAGAGETEGTGEDITYSETPGPGVRFYRLLSRRR